MAARKTPSPTTEAATTPPVEPRERPAFVGQCVLYRVSEEDTSTINYRRVRAARFPQLRRNGEQAHLGNAATVGDIYPMVIIRVWVNGSVNGQVLLDGNDVLWVTSRAEGDKPGTWTRDA